MEKTYVVAADAARARIFVREANALREIEALTHSESRLHTGDLRTGGKGEATSGASQRQTGDDSATSDKHESFFAKEVAEYLRDARTKHNVEAFILIAAPQFLGELRDKLDKPTQALVTKTLDKDVSKASEDEIAKKLGWS
ncbi:host attachment protein [Salinicola aestuarinus]|uniref:baeRF12 domain-containing protein n=1 Tax=Salinicola aestuarinus TaxID=1949082 RepID=UPI000DA22EB3|nr:host attachment family protein [Salinicola aestuarinus]